MGAVVLAVTAGLPASAGAQQVTLPAPTGLVNDFANVIDEAAESRMTRVAEDVRAKSRGEIAIVTLPSIGVQNVADVALRIGREWKVGKVGNPGDPTRNAGAVILLVPKETNSDGRGRCFVLTGQGTEGFITDATAAEICREATPAFRVRDYSTGIELITLRTAQRFANEFNFSIDTALVPVEPVYAPRRQSRGIPPFVFIILFFIVLQVLSRASRRGQQGKRGRRDGCGGGMPIIMPIPMGGRGGSWGGGGFGGGGGGFGGFGGGGGFSGGGGGSDW